jgi:hypothetical protein
MTFEDVAMKARTFAVKQGFSDLFLELEGGEFGADGRWHMRFRMTGPFTSVRVDVTLDDATQQVVGLTRSERHSRA